jgi:NADH dehydrogenase FAD-containing subunit
MAALNPSDIAYPIRSIFKRQDNVVAVLLGEVTDVDKRNRQIVIDGEEVLSYDYLVLATGSTHSYFGNDHWQEFAPGLKTVEDALKIRANVLSAFERAERHPQRAETLMTFVVVGGGPTGVELAGALAEIAVRALANEFDNVNPYSARIVLVEGATRLLPLASLSRVVIGVGPQAGRGTWCGGHHRRICRCYRCGRCEPFVWASDRLRNRDLGCRGDGVAGGNDDWDR